MSVKSKLLIVNAELDKLKPLATNVLFATFAVTTLLGSIKTMETMIFVRRLFVFTSFAIALIFILQYFLDLYFKPI
jgi:hypothetical protein